ncbi:MAG: HNH endonuclease [Gemmataceae bacterium]
MEEVWRDVVGYEGKYRVSNAGRLQNVRSGRFLNGSPNAGGYVVVRLTVERGRGRMYYLHRVVCAAFHGAPPTDAHVVNHLNGRKADCRASNLCWCSRAENNAHAAKLGLHKGRSAGARNPNAKLTDERVVELRRLSREGVGYTELGASYGVTPATAYRAAVGQSWRHLRDVSVDAVREAGAETIRRAADRRRDK